jgi:hypothetical protein
MLERFLESAAATEGLGERMSQHLAPGCVLYLRAGGCSTGICTG